ncbi:MAG: putative DNA binding domain-containing protein [bacterium]|nr:putative DNA binding domain-containing protein [bacterium]MDE0669738.1 putative DNA binding domain-containing protein [bacterium]
MTTGAVERALGLGPEGRASELLGLAEDQWFDRKSARVGARDLADTLLAFANAEGGTVVVGLWNGEVEGIDAAGPAMLARWQQAAIDFTAPPVPHKAQLVECRNSRGERDRLFVVQVEVSEQVHTNRKDEVYLRVGDENRRLTYAQRQELLYDKGQAAYEVTPVAGAGLDDLNRELLGNYAGALEHPDPERLLDARGLLTRSGELTVAAVLLFGANPQRWLPGASVRVLRFGGSERGSGARQQLLSDVRIEGPIPLLLGEARRAIVDTLPARRALAAGDRFERIPLIPTEAWLEGLVNAVIHRSYSIGGDHIRVEIFDDRVEIESPGRFPGVVDLRDPLQISRFARNPRVARVCADLRLAQELGEGIRRMFDEMRLAGLADPGYVQTAGSVRLTLSSAVVDRALEERLPRAARGILRLIREAGRLSTGEAAEATGSSRPAVLRQLRSLEREGLIEWVGKSKNDPRAYWKLRVD